MIVELEKLAGIVQTGVVISRIEKKTVEAFTEALVLSLRSINCGTINMDELDKIKVAKPIDPSKTTGRGDIVVKMNKPYDVAFIEEDMLGLVLPSFCCKISDIKREWVDPYYLTGYLNSQVVKAYLLAANGSSAASLLKIKDIRKLPVALPTLQEQQAIGKIFRNYCQKQILLKEMQQHELQMTQTIIMNAATEVYKSETNS